MPIKIQSDLPVKEILEKENIFVMDEGRAVHQDIRPIRILILNLMPLKEDTELQLLRSLSNTPLQVDVSFMMVATHESKNTATSHLNKFYETFEQVKDHKFDGMIITGGTLHGASIHTLLDHRIAMAFSIAALVADGTTKILDSKCVDVSYPTFYDTFEQLL